MSFHHGKHMVGHPIFHLHSVYKQSCSFHCSEFQIDLNFIRSDCFVLFCLIELFSFHFENCSNSLYGMLRCILVYVEGMLIHLFLFIRFTCQVLTIEMIFFLIGMILHNELFPFRSEFITILKIALWSLIHSFIHFVSTGICLNVCYWISLCSRMRSPAGYIALLGRWKKKNRLISKDSKDDRMMS